MIGTVLHTMLVRRTPRSRRVKVRPVHGTRLEDPSVLLAQRTPDLVCEPLPPYASVAFLIDTSRFPLLFSPLSLK